MIAAVANNRHIAQSAGRDSGACCNLGPVGESVCTAGCTVAIAAIASDQHIATVGGDGTIARHDDAFIVSRFRQAPPTGDGDIAAPPRGDVTSRMKVNTVIKSGGVARAATLSCHGGGACAWPGTDAARAIDIDPHLLLLGAIHKARAVDNHGTIGTRIDRAAVNRHTRATDRVGRGASTKTGDIDQPGPTGGDRGIGPRD